MKFQEVIGQEGLKAELRKEIISGKIAHAQLFSGKSGYGSLPLALAFSQFMFCQNRSETDSCGVCPSCVRVREMQHPDLHFVFPVVLASQKISDNALVDWREQLRRNPYFDLYDWTKRIDSKERKPIIGADESQEIIRKLNLKSFEGGPKVMIIWMVEEMNAFCANKLLKILEEPPINTYFILVAENPDKLLVTIQSRTQKVKIPKIATDDLSVYLSNQLSVGRAEANSAASFSEGDYLRAVEFLSASEDKNIYREQFIQLMRTSYKKDVLAMMDWAESMSSETKERQKLFLVYALHMFRQSILANYVGSSLMHVSEEEANFLQNFSPFISGNNIREFQETFDTAYYHIDRNANAKILFTQLCFQAMRFIHVA